MSKGKKKQLTTAAGIPVGDNQNALTAGPRGPLLVQDWQLFEKHAHFNRERIPERVVHAKGSGAYGTFTCTADITRFTKAAIFSAVGKKTECFARFSTVAGERGAADAERIISQDRESHQRDLFESIEKGEFPKWRVKVQVMPEKDAEKTPYNPFDLTKVWPHADYPLVDVGIMELNRNPENYFAEVEQAAFSPANLPPGIGHSPDKMLQFRIFSYADAHRYRLGVNYESLPVNRPRVEAATYHRDGAMRFDGNGGGSVNYEPNSFDGPAEDRKFVEPPLPIGGAADRYDHRQGNDDYAQAGNLYRLLPAAERERLHRAIAGAMDGVPREVVDRQLAHFDKADPAYGKGVRAALGR